MDLFKMRRETPAAERESARSLEQLLASPAPSPPSDGLPEPMSMIANTPSSFDLKPAVSTRSESTIAEGFHFNGVVKAPSDLLRVDGALEGEVEVRVLVIGSTGSVSGQCRCDSLVIEGRFQGRAECRELQLHNGSVIDGEVTYAIVRAQRGAQMTGKYAHKKRGTS